MKDEEILKEVLENWKGSNIYHKDVQAIAYQSISLSREDEQKKILDLIDSYIKVFPQMFDNPPKDQVIDMIAWNFSIKYLDNFAKELKQKINQLSGKEKK